MQLTNGFFLILFLSFSLSAATDIDTFQNQTASDQKISDEKQPQKEEIPTISEKANETIQETAESISKEAIKTRLRRGKSKYFALINYSPFDLIVPSKYGLTMGLTRSIDQTWELEYLQGSFSLPFVIKNLGEMTDQRVSFINRSYSGSNSFNFNYGISYFDFVIHLGDEFLNRVTGGRYSSLDLVGLQSLGFNVGFGNRWTWKKNITVGLDWISWSQPVFIINQRSAFLDHASHQKDKDDVSDTLKIVSYFPRLSFLKLQVGILF